MYLSGNVFIAHSTFDPAMTTALDSTPRSRRHQRCAYLRLVAVVAPFVYYAQSRVPYEYPTTEGRDIIAIPDNDDAMSYRKAREESGGFFTDIRESDWALLKERVMSRIDHANGNNPTANADNPAVWYQNNYEPDFTCMHERRVGGMGDGPKWVCDPHRIDNRTCLVYSIGSAGKTEFERGVRDAIGSGCEVHTFDVKNYNRRNGDFAENCAKVGCTFHHFGIQAEDKPLKEGMKTLKQTVAELGHEGRSIDIFKIDCEGCEFDVYKDWFTSGVILRQILVEVHYVPIPQTLDFFRRLQNDNYVCFHKEANTLAKPTASAWEYAFLRLDSSFWGSGDNKSKISSAI